MPGSASNPIVLDPLQTIIEVHWSVVKYIALLTRLDIDTTNAPTEPYQSGDPVVESPSGAYWYGWLATLKYKYVSASLYEGRVSKDVVKWSSASGATVTTSPSLPAESTFNHWEKPSAGATQFNSWLIGGPKGHIATPTGSSLSVPLPDDQSGEFFRAGTSINAEVLGDKFTGEPVRISGFLERYAPCTATLSPGERYTNATAYASCPLDFSGVTAKRQKKTFTPIGIGLQGGNDFMGGKDFAASIAVLFERTE